MHNNSMNRINKRRRSKSEKNHLTLLWHPKENTVELFIFFRSWSFTIQLHLCYWCVSFIKNVTCLNALHIHSLFSFDRGKNHQNFMMINRNLRLTKTKNKSICLWYINTVDWNCDFWPQKCWIDMFELNLLQLSLLNRLQNLTFSYEIEQLKWIIICVAI